MDRDRAYAAYSLIVAVLMLMRLWGLIRYPDAIKDADRLLRDKREGALDLARHGVRASGEKTRSGHWTRVVREIERRSKYRPW